MIAAKFVTASMLECENYVQEAGAPPETNIDMKSIAFKGVRL